MARNYNPGLSPAENNRLTLNDQVQNGATAAAYIFPSPQEEIIARSLANLTRSVQEAGSDPIVVANDAERFALTPAEAPLATFVQVTATGNNYIVVDTAELDNENGYVVLPPAGPARLIARQGTAAEIASIVLDSGEVAYATDTKDVYMGDGVTLGGVLWSRGSLIFGLKERASSGTNLGGTGTPGAAGSSNNQLALVRGGNGGNNSATLGGNGGAGGSCPNDPLEIIGGNGGAAGSGNGGAGGIVQLAGLRVRGGNGGAGSTTGTGAGGGGGAARAVQVLGGTGGAGSGDFSGGNGGAGGLSVTGAIRLLGGNGGASDGTAAGGNGGDSGQLRLEGGAGGASSGAVAGGAGGRGSIILGIGSAAVASTAGANAGDITLSANGTRAGGSLNLSAGASAAGGSIDISNSGIIIRTGTGSPESVVTAVVGSLFLRTDGGAGTTLYVKETGTGSTGWAAK